MVSFEVKAHLSGCIKEVNSSYGFHRNEGLPCAAMNKTERLTQLHQWLTLAGYDSSDLRKASEDASFRQYFRLGHAPHSFIVMDCPPAQESLQTFINVAQTLFQAGVQVPNILASDVEQGFAVITDFGTTPYLDVLSAERADALYAEALKSLLHLQTHVNASDFPLYDGPFLAQEMALFHDWFMQQLLGIKLDTEDETLWQYSVDNLTACALEQPRVLVHRDYHSRNLMLVNDQSCGIIDFQDAMNGPLTYDLVSLLKDCYIAWPQQQVQNWVQAYHQQCQAKGLTDGDSQTFMRWFDLMGAQRHLKAVGIFARLKLRDGKPGYLKDIPRTLGYLQQVSEQYPALKGLNTLLKKHHLLARIEAILRT